jgi:drug/metabolite transporter (DMT)-like permease
LDNLRGSLLMVAAMAGFAFEDMFLKLAGRAIPVGQMLILFGLVGTLAFAALTRARGQRVLVSALTSRAILIRAAFEVTGRLGYVLALVFTDLSSASAILQATPLVVVAGAAVIFGEKVGWRRWLAITVGFIGVLVILRPATDAFVPASLFAVTGMLGFAGRDLATRAAPAGISNLQLGTYGFFVLIPTGAVVLAVTGGAVWPDPAAALALAGACGVGVVAYYWLTAAMRVGEVSVVTPYRYSRLLFALALGAVIFGERPDSLTLIGSGIVIGSGLYTIIRGRMLARRA